MRTVGVVSNDPGGNPAVTVIPVYGSRCACVKVATPSATRADVHALVLP